MATIIKSDGQKVSVMPHDNDRGFRNDELTKCIGGSIEVVRIPTPGKQNRIMIVCDVGHMCNMPVNKRATKIYRDTRRYPCSHTIVGDVLIANMQNPGQASETIK